jgi:hypothetical protein
MLRERIIWIVALLLVAGGGFYSGQLIGSRTATQQRAQAAQQFFGQRGGQNGGQGGQRGGQGGGQGGFAGRGGASGTVASVSGNTVTITTRSGQNMTINLAASTTVRKLADGQVSDIKQGEQITAFGTQNGDTFDATSIQIGQLGGGRPQGQGQPTAQPSQ